MTSIPNRSIMLLSLEAEVNPNMTNMKSFLNTLIGNTKKIPQESFDKIIDGILSKDYHTRFDFDRTYDSIAVWEHFETFSIESDGDGYLVCLDIKVNYEVLLSEVVNDVVFSIEKMMVFDNGGDEMVIDGVQADQIKQAVESKNYKG